MIADKKTLKEYVQYEGKIYGYKKPLRFLPRLKETAIVYKLLCLYRYEEYHYNLKHRFLYKIYHFLRRSFERKLGIHFDGINMVDKGIYIPHIGPMHIRAKHIGKNCSLLQQVNIITGNDGGTPYIGDCVAIGVGATIVGNIKIANGVAIGANSLVCKTVDIENVTIAGNPSKIVSNNGSKTWGGYKVFPEKW